MSEISRGDMAKAIQKVINSGGLFSDKEKLKVIENYCIRMELLNKLNQVAKSP